MFGTVPEHCVRGFAFFGVGVQERSAKMDTGHNFSHDLHPHCGETLSGDFAIYCTGCSGWGGHPGRLPRAGVPSARNRATVRWGSCRRCVTWAWWR
jgi:hypothetical protein